VETAKEEEIIFLVSRDLSPDYLTLGRLPYVQFPEEGQSILIRWPFAKVVDSPYYLLLLASLHPLLENVLQTVDHFQISCLGAPFSWLEKTKNCMKRDLNCMAGVLIRTVSRTDLGPIQPPIQSVPWVLSLIVKRSGCEADHSHPYSAEVKECVEIYLQSSNTTLRRNA
jgi:hypothetical protein